MKLGAQVYSIRNFIQTPEAYLDTMKKLKAQGYDTIQHAGPDIQDPYLLRDLTQQAGLSHVCPNINTQVVRDEPQRAIECLKVLGCDSMMLPCISGDTMASLNGFLQGWKPLEGSLLKIREAGIRLCYHNHAFDMAPMSDWDGSFVEYALENMPHWEFILDVAWAQYAGVDTLAYMEKLGKRINCIHFKDYSASINKVNQPVFCACGAGKVALEVYGQKVREMGIRDVIVEQDNAQDYPDPFGQMEASARYIKGLF